MAKVRGAIASTTGTNTPEILSASAWMGALLVYASCTSATIRASAVSAPGGAAERDAAVYVSGRPAGQGSRPAPSRPSPRSCPFLHHRHWWWRWQAAVRRMAVGACSDSSFVMASEVLPFATFSKYLHNNTRVITTPSVTLGEHAKRGEGRGGNTGRA